MERVFGEGCQKAWALESSSSSPERRARCDEAYAPGKLVVVTGFAGVGTEWSAPIIRGLHVKAQGRGAAVC
ncbi:MAG: hypothetical protein MUC96_08650 [Myxococcaceae bacterium]|nr:hypothetical protein [Myxococcaceae bacterium]